MSKTSDSLKVYTYYCAQLEGEQTKHKLNEDKNKQRARMTMDRYNCYGWLNISVDDDDLSFANIRITHHLSHHPYTDISITPEVEEIVEKLQDLTAAKVRKIKLLMCHFI